MNSFDRSIIEKSLSGIVFSKMDPAYREPSLRTAIGQICTMLGIKSSMQAKGEQDVEFLMIYKFFKQYYSTITMEEFIHAFELNILGHYPKKHEHFQLFNIEFIAGVMTDYMQLKLTAKQSFNAAKKTEPLPAHNTTDEDLFNTLVTYFQKNGMPQFWNWSRVYAHMKANDMVKESREWQDNFKNEIQLRIENELIDKKLQEPEAVKRLKLDDLLKPENIKSACHEAYVRLKLPELAQVAEKVQTAQN